MVRFDYIEPCSLKEATTLVSAQDTKGKIIAGGTDLLVQIKERKLDVDRLISLSKIPGLRFIHDDGRWINIGTMTTIRDLEQSSVVQKSLPVLFDAVEGFGSVQIRNVATLGEYMQRGPLGRYLTSPARLEGSGDLSEFQGDEEAGVK